MYLLRACLFCSASLAPIFLPGEEMLIAFSSKAFAGGFDQVWQSVTPVKELGSDKLDARKVTLPLHDAESGKRTGLSLTLTPPQMHGRMVTHQNSEANPTDIFTHNPFSWFDPKLPALRETFSFDPKSKPWILELKGLKEDDVVHIDWVFMRHKEGERRITLVGPDGIPLLDQAHVGSDQKGVYFRSGPFRGASSLRFTIRSAGELWPCLPNAIRVVRKSSLDR